MTPIGYSAKCWIVAIHLMTEINCWPRRVLKVCADEIGFLCLGMAHSVEALLQPDIQVKHLLPSLILVSVQIETNYPRPCGKTA